MGEESGTYADAYPLQSQPSSDVLIAPTRSGSPGNDLAVKKSPRPGAANKALRGYDDVKMSLFPSNTVR